MEYLDESDRNQAPEQVIFLVGLLKKGQESTLLNALQTYTEEVISIQRQKNSLANMGENNPYFNIMLHKQIEYMEACANYTKAKCMDCLEKIESCCDYLQIPNPYINLCFLRFGEST